MFRSTSIRPGQSLQLRQFTSCQCSSQICLCSECYEAFVVYNFLMFLARYCALAEPPASLRQALLQERKLEGCVCARALCWQTLSLAVWRRPRPNPAPHEAALASAAARAQDATEHHGTGRAAGARARAVAGGLGRARVAARDRAAPEGPPLPQGPGAPTCLQPRRKSLNTRAPPARQRISEGPCRQRPRAA